ncbi:MAG: hypothetical protein H6Q33_4497 [Deltaproteobacteria bacterium]|nr:hypothetical protein [Deltaproteobacteria bacterium]
MTCSSRVHEVAPCSKVKVTQLVTKTACLTLLVSAFLSGCASKLVTYDSERKPSVGIPVGSPILVKITRRTNYEVDPSNRSYEPYCTPDLSATYEFLALGERSYISFSPADLGKGEFKLEFNDAGLLKLVSLNSDATAGAAQINELLKTVLPFVTAPKAAETQILAADQTAQNTKDKYCIKKGTEVIRVERATIN